MNLNKIFSSKIENVSTAVTNNITSEKSNLLTDGTKISMVYI